MILFENFQLLEIQRGYSPADELCSYRISAVISFLGIYQSRVKWQLIKHDTSLYEAVYEAVGLGPLALGIMRPLWMSFFVVSTYSPAQCSHYYYKLN